MDLELTASTGEVHRLKSEYVEAIGIQTQLVRDIPRESQTSTLALTLGNMAQNEVEISGSGHTARMNIHKARTLSKALGHLKLVNWCDSMEAALNMREGALQAAKASLQKCATVAWARDPEVTTYCLGRLAESDATTNDPSSRWPMVFLAYSLDRKSVV